MNTLDRLGTKDWVEPDSEEELKRAVDIIGKKAEIIGKYAPTKKKREISHAVKKRIIETVTVRPCTVRDLAEILNLHVNEVNKYLSEIDKEYNIKTKEQKRGRFYFLSKEE